MVIVFDLQKKNVTVFNYCEHQYTCEAGATVGGFLADLPDSFVILIAFALSLWHDSILCNPHRKWLLTFQLPFLATVFGEVFFFFFIGAQSSNILTLW